jgi:hypothetical protein
MSRFCANPKCVVCHPDVFKPVPGGVFEACEPASLNVKPTNPKDAIGVMKVPLHLVSPISKAYQAIAHFLGNVKYGAWNYRACGARASIYKSALERHMDRWFSGEENDPADGTPHLANALACINILIETQYAGNMIDDRPPKLDVDRAYRMVEELMPKIVEKYKDRDPKHYTIADTGANDAA